MGLVPPHLHLRILDDLLGILSGGVQELLDTSEVHATEIFSLLPLNCPVRKFRSISIAKNLKVRSDNRQFRILGNNLLHCRSQRFGLARILGVHPFDDGE